VGRLARARSDTTAVSARRSLVLPQRLARRLREFIAGSVKTEHTHGFETPLICFGNLSCSVGPMSASTETWIPKSRGCGSAALEGNLVALQVTAALVHARVSFGILARQVTTESTQVLGDGHCEAPSVERATIRPACLDWRTSWPRPD
jgi:hypothetical protein